LANLVAVFGQANSQSRYYYAIENLDTAQIIRRGQTTTNGIPRNGLILAPSTHYREWLFEADTGLIGFSDFTTPPPGSRFDIPTIRLGLPLTPDTDGDGLSDDGERIVNGNPTNRFSFVAGVEDGAAARLGLIDQSGAFTGIIGSVDTPGTAVDVCAFNDIGVVANSSAGISVFNVFNRMAPLIIAQVETPGTATAVACAGGLIAVADGSAGLAIVDISDPPNAGIIHQVDVGGGTAQAVATAGGLGFVGTDQGNGKGLLTVVDLPTGFVLQQLSIAPVQDLAIEGDTLYAYGNSQLLILTNAFGSLALARTITSPGGQQPFNGRGRIFVGGGLAYLVRADGYNRFSVTNTATAQLLNSVITSQIGWKHIVPDGTGVAVAARGVNPRDDGTHNVSLYSVVNTATNSGFITEFPTPGVARAVAIYNGLAYVADSAAGLQVINYEAIDLAGVRPGISITPTFTLTTPTNGVVEEGKLVRVTARASDDRQVRNVELYIDGVKAATDGNFPFEFQFIAPRRVGRTSFSLQARASDTGGNFTFTDPIVVNLLPDTTPPRLVGSFPPANGIVTNADSLFFYFNEPIDPATLGGTNLTIIFAGADHRLGTLDDLVLTNGLFSFRDSINAAVVAFPSSLLVGQYLISVTGNIRDLAGNSLTNPPARPFWLLPDGTGGDYDNDGLTNSLEIVRGTNPLLMDTDSDGWDDGVETGDGTNPLDSNSRPRITLASAPPIEMNLLTPEETGAAGSPMVVAAPPVETYLVTPEDTGISGFSFVLARPPAELYLSTLEDIGGNVLGSVLAFPPLEIQIMTDEQVGLLGLPLFLAVPPVEVQIASPEGVGQIGAPLVLALPPAQIQFATNTPAPANAGAARLNPPRF
jgi:hypothetical protein